MTTGNLYDLIQDKISELERDYPTVMAEIRAKSYATGHDDTIVLVKQAHQEGRIEAANKAIDLFIQKIESDKDYGFPSDILLNNKDYVMDIIHEGESK